MKALKELWGKIFFVPNYQRGYRWTTQQVNDLLNDLSEFADGKDARGATFYSMQPLVVKKRSVNGEKEEWELVDGQQRLTTFYLLYRALHEDVKKPDFFEVRYERSEKSLSESFDAIKKLDVSTIELYHLSNAYQTIMEWLGGHNSKKEQLSNLLDACESGMGSDGSKKDVVHNVRFIWYVTQEEDAIRVFTRLNIGKISLTSAELIRALLLNQKNFLRETRSLEIAAEWDRIENRLQRPDFWFFLSNDTSYAAPTRIDYIFKLMVDSNALALDLDEESEKGIGTDRYRSFRYFYAYFRKRDNDVDNCWDRIREYYQIFIVWYDDIELYHYVGYLLASGEKVQTLVGMWKSEKTKNKRDFCKDLKKKIREMVEKHPLDYQFKPDGSDKGECKPILLFHNIQTVIDRAKRGGDRYGGGTDYRFPFHLYKLESWDVEHINPVTDNDLADDDARNEWLLNLYLGASADVQEMIKDYFELSDSGEKKSQFNKIRERYPDPKDWTDEQKNQIGNYTLLDSSTNRSYGNAIFSAKRRIIIDKDKGYLTPLPVLTKDGKHVIKGEKDGQQTEGVPEESEKSQVAGLPFVPPCTLSVFMKYYSPVAGNSNYWEISDAEAYVNDIQKCINRLKEKDNGKQ